MPLSLPRLMPARRPSVARLAHVELSPIKEVELRASRLPGVISLAQGIPSFDTPEAIKAAAQRMIAEGMCAKYSVTPGLPRLREAIAEALLRDGMRYDPDAEILVTVGSIEAIAATLLASIDPGEEVLVVSPTYASYLPAIRIAGGLPRFVPLEEDSNFDLDPDAIEEAVGRRTRALLICNPNNPTGTVFSERQTRRMLEVAERHDLLVITDEVYKDFIYGDTRLFSAAMEPAARERVIRVFSFSKAFGMTGWRVGFLHGHASRVAEVLKVHDSLVTCAPVVSQYAALAALEVGDSAVAEFRSEFRRRRDRVIERLDRLPQIFDYQKPNASYFVFPRVKDTVPHARDSRRLAAEILERARVALVPGVAFGPSGEAHLRLCYARPPEDVDRAFDRLEDFFAGRPARVRPAPPAQAGRGGAGRHPLRRAGLSLLRHLARTRVRRRRPKIIAIAGMQGKTVMKRTLEELLGPHFAVRANPLSHNTEIGLPLAVLGCELSSRRPLELGWSLVRALWSGYLAGDPLDVLILELGVGKPGDMRAHLETIRPDFAIVTPLQPSLSADHEELEVMRREIEVLCSSLRATGAPILLCGDDPALAALARELPGALVFSRADVEGENGRHVLRIEPHALLARRDTVGISSVYALIAAVRVGRMLGLDDRQIEAFLNQ